MYFVSATRLKVKSFFSLPAFMMANEASIKQLSRTKGFVEGKELMDKGLTFWTITLWNSDADMKGFRNSIPHRKAMQKLPGWCSEATYTHWLQEETVLPAWNTIHEKIVKEGIVTKVRHPSQHHSSKLFPPVKWARTERAFKPK